MIILTFIARTYTSIQSPSISTLILVLNFFVAMSIKRLHRIAIEPIIVTTLCSMSSIASPRFTDVTRLRCASLSFRSILLALDAWERNDFTDCNDFKEDELAFEGRPPNTFLALDVLLFDVDFEIKRLELKLGGASSSCFAYAGYFSFIKIIIIKNDGWTQREREREREMNKTYRREISDLIGGAEHRRRFVKIHFFFENVNLFNICVLLLQETFLKECKQTKNSIS